MDFWQKARSFAEEAAKRSQELTSGIDTSKLTEVVSEASKRSKEIAAEASKMSKEIAAEAFKRADQIKVQLPPAASVISNLVESNSPSVAVVVSEAELKRFGITDELREFVKGITEGTFQDFPLEDDTEISDIPTVSNVRQDLSEFQEKHAKLVLTSVKEVSKLRYKLCPRVIKERKFWRIYFILVKSHVDPYERRYIEEAALKSIEKSQDDGIKEVAPNGSVKDETTNQKTKTTATTASEQDLDVFLLGDDAGESDGDDGADDKNDDFDDDFDKI